MKRFRPMAVTAALVLSFSLSLWSPSIAGSTVSNTWVDQSVKFSAGSLTVYATYRHPKVNHGPFPGVLLIAGSGPTDRNGNSTVEPGSVNTLKTLADWLSVDGVATLRYDKLGSGQTGLGPYANNPDAIGILPFEQESVAALRFLSKQTGINKKRLGVFGHSEGALYALLLASGHAGTVPPIHALGLFEPLSLRYLDLIGIQIDAQIAAQVKSGAISKKLASSVTSTATSVIARLRRTGKVSADLPYGLSLILSPSSATYLYQADKLDPQTVASMLRVSTPVLVTCSFADSQVTCPEVNRIVHGLTSAKAKIDFVQLSNVDHVLKVDPSGQAANYTKSLPFSSRLRSAIQSFVERSL
jgi:hypothetical protein